jgi:hypothetical protein
MADARDPQKVPEETHVRPVCVAPLEPAHDRNLSAYGMQAGRELVARQEGRARTIQIWFDRCTRTGAFWVRIRHVSSLRTRLRRPSSPLWGAFSVNSPDYAPHRAGKEGPTLI